MDACRGKYYFVNRTFKPSVLFNPTVFSSGSSLYEVIRIHKATGLFVEEHWHRFLESAHHAGLKIQLPETFSVAETLQKVILRNRLSSGNIKLVYHIQEDLANLYAFFIPHVYPTMRMYHTGVDTDLLMATRPDPNTKMIRSAISNASSQFCQSHQLYEVLLVNHENIITEGSRSNVFFIKGDALYTAPDAIILKGITREKILGLCRLLHYKVFEYRVSPLELSQFDAAFLTGTSPQVLPIRRIGSYHYNPHHIITASLCKAYQKLVQEYINKKIG